MRARFVIAILGVALACAMAASPVVGAQRLTVHIEVTSPFTPDLVPFAASGPAVDSGLLPATGFVSTVGFTVLPSPHRDGFLYATVVKHFACDDGTFDVEIAATINLNAGTEAGDLTGSGHWKILGGTGSYTDLKGIGSTYSTQCVPGESVYDFYDGGLKTK